MDLKPCKIHIYFLFLLIFINGLPLSALAKERLYYSEDIPRSSSYALQTYFGEEFFNYVFAQSDLNSDGFDELILKERLCEMEQDICNHIVVAETKTAIIELANIRARQLVIDNKKYAGVHDILAFQNTLNDYDYNIYRWEPAQSRYILVVNDNSGAVNQP